MKLQGNITFKAIQNKTDDIYKDAIREKIGFELQHAYVFYIVIFNTSNHQNIRES